MHVLHFLDSLNRGGAETLVSDLCRNRDLANFELSFGYNSGGALENEIIESGVRVHKLKRRLPVDPALVVALRRMIKTDEIDIIHTHQAVDAIHAYAAAGGTKTKVVLTHHGIVSDTKNRLALKQIIPRVDANVVVGRAMIDQYKQDHAIEFPQSTSVIYNGIDLNRIKPTGKDVREELEIKSTAPLIGMVGNFYVEKRKDQLTVCNVMPTILEKFPDAHLIFAGKTQPGAEHKLDECINFCRDAGISERVHFLGGRNDVPDILAALNVFVFSTFLEGLPIAINEAMLARCPIVASDIPTVVEASDNGNCAEIFAAADRDDLARKVIDLLRDENKKSRLIDKAAMFAKENFSINAHLGKLDQLYRSLI